MSYLMESPAEGERLLAQARENPSLERLARSGLGPGMRALDAGCGSGATLPAMLQLVGARGSVVGVEPGEARLREAQALVTGHDNVEVLRRSLPDTGLPDSSFDYVWSQYVFEYFADPVPALHELIRLARPGGRVVVADIDGFGLQYWPAPPAVEAGREKFLRALARTGFDLHVGRKLYTLFHAAGLVDLAVHLSPFYVAAGTASDTLIADWKQRFEVLRPVALPEFGSAEEYDTFGKSYLDMLSDPASLKYAVVLTTGGTKR